MKMRKLGEIAVSEIGMGCMGFSHGYGQIPPEDYSVEAIGKALDYGCTFLDTSEAYGPFLAETGHNEKIVGKAIKGRREDVVLATKLFLGTEEVKRGSAYDGLRRHLDASLRRLGTDYVDLYYLHRINPAVPVETVAEGMGRLIEDGMIRGWGLSMVTTDFIERAHRITPVTAVQNIYSMWFLSPAPKTRRGSSKIWAHGRWNCPTRNLPGWKRLWRGYRSMDGART